MSDRMPVTIYGPNSQGLTGCGWETQGGLHCIRPIDDAIPLIRRFTNVLNWFEVGVVHANRSQYLERIVATLRGLGLPDDTIWIVITRLLQMDDDCVRMALLRW